MTEETAGFLEDATSSIICVSTSREVLGRTRSRLSKASFNCASAFCTCNRQLRRDAAIRRRPRGEARRWPEVWMPLLNLLVLVHAQHAREHRRDDQRHL